MRLAVEAATETFPARSGLATIVIFRKFGRANVARRGLATTAILGRATITLLQVPPKRAGCGGRRLATIPLLKGLATIPLLHILGGGGDGGGGVRGRGGGGQGAHTVLPVLPVQQLKGERGGKTLSKFFVTGWPDPMIKQN